LEYAIRRVKDNHEGLKQNGTHQLLAYADDNKLGENIATIQKNTQVVLQNKFNGNLPCHSQVMKCVLTDITSDVLQE
jgi:hypothetical protein